MKKILFVASLLLSVLSCSKQSTNSVTPSDVRDKFVGQWARSYSSQCKGGTSTQNGTFTITKSSTKSDIVILDYGLDAISKCEAIISSDAISYSKLSTLYADQSGSGKISSDGKTINIIGVSDAGAYVGICTTNEVWTKK
jgi:hypothetical protein